MRLHRYPWRSDHNLAAQIMHLPAGLFWGLALALFIIVASFLILLLRNLKSNLHEHDDTDVCPVCEQERARGRRGL